MICMKVPTSLLIRVGPVIIIFIYILGLIAIFSQSRSDTNPVEAKTVVNEDTSVKPSESVQPAEFEPESIASFFPARTEAGVIAKADA